MESPTERELVEACRQGDTAAQAWLVRRYSKPVFGVCMGILGNAHDAEDLAQDALVKAMTQIDRLRDQDHFGKWLFRIARNLCIDYIRRQKIGREALTKVKQPSEDPPVEDHPELREAIARLPEKYRVPLLLYYFEGRNTEAVAAMLGISPAGVCSRLSRARTKLRFLMSEKRDGHESL